MRFLESLSAIFTKPENEQDAKKKLAKAAKDGDLKEVERIAGLFPQSPQWELGGGTAHLIAAQHGHNDILLFMLGRGADIEAKNSSGYTALAVAAWMGQEKTALLLIERGASPAGDPLKRARDADKGNILKMMHQASKLRENYHEAQAAQKMQAADAVAEDFRQGTEEKIGLLKKIRFRVKNP